MGFIGKPLKNQLDSSIQIENFMENGKEISISDFRFRSTFNKGSAGFSHAFKMLVKGISKAS